MKYRKKPVVIEAFQIGIDQVPEWFKKRKDIIEDKLEHCTIYTIKTLEGEMSCSTGEWVIKGVKGELYTCKPDIFEMTYEKVEP